MNRVSTIILTAALAGAGTMQAQSLSVEAKQAYNAIKGNLTRMAEKVPEDQYGFKPTPDIRTFGELIGHIAESQTRTCSAVAGTMQQLSAKGKTSKADLVALLKESFETCDAAYNSLTDANAAEVIKTPRGDRTKLGALAGNTTHDNEEYGYMAVYLRLKGIVPPSSDRK